MAKDEWLIPSETVKRLAELGYTGEDGQPYKPQILRRWEERYSDYPTRLFVTPRLSMDNWPLVLKWVEESGPAR